MRKIKTWLGVVLAIVIGINSISFTVIASDANDSEYFTYTVTDGKAKIMTFTNNVTEVTLPEKIIIDNVNYTAEDGTLIIGANLFRYNSCIVEKVIYPPCYNSVGYNNMFRDNISIKEVSFLYTGSEFKLYNYCFRGCQTLERVYFYSDSLTFGSTTSNLFTDVPSTAIAYVKSVSVQETLNNAGWPGTIVVDPNMGSTSTNVNKDELQATITETETYLSSLDKSLYEGVTALDVLEIALANAKEIYDNASATQDEVTNATTELMSAKKALQEIVLTDKTALAEKITEAETLIASIEDESKWLNVTNLKNEIVIAKGIYDDNTATQTSVDQEVKYLNTAIELCHAIPDKVLLRGWINIADNFMADKVSSDYTNGAEITQKISNAKSMLPNTANVTQAEVDEMCQYLDDLVNHRIELVPADSTSQRTALQTAIAEAELIENNNYTDESWEALQSVIASAKEIYEIEGGLRSEYTNAKTAIQSAIDALELDPGIIEEPGAPFIKVEKNAKEAVLDTYTADENTVGAVKIKVTFDCASDVSYNPSASIELKAMVGTTESYSKFYGTDETYTNGQKGFEIELPLTSAIAEGDEVELTAYTYAWNEAADYVYGITKVEYVNEVGQILKVITDRTIALDELKADIAEAEAIEQGDYSDESFAVLQTAIGAAKLVADNAEKAVIDEVREALAKAIAGLTTEPIIVTGTVSGTIKVSDENAETEMTVTAVSADGTETSVTATSMGTYALENLEAGEYTLTISGGKYAERSYEITVTEGEIAQDVELNPYGDINGDGKVTTADVGMANSHAKGVTELTGYEFVCANVSGDEIISTADVGMINSHAKSVSTLW